MKVRAKTSLADLIGSGDRIMLVTLPFLVAGLALQVAFPSFFEVGGPPSWLRTVSIVVMIVGLVVWLWAVALVLRKVPRGELITSGPFAVMKHPIYVGFSLLVLPWLGFVLNSWLGAALGIVIYAATQLYAHREEDVLALAFGPAWDDYCSRVKMPWL
jgi:protein-S-isoprenylcysteine O-methyltransferase Ste14